MSSSFESLQLSLLLSVLLSVVVFSQKLPQLAHKQSHQLLSAAVQEVFSSNPPSESSSSAVAPRGLVVVNDKYVLDLPIQTPFAQSTPRSVVPWETTAPFEDDTTMLNGVFILDDRFSRGGCGEVWFAKDLRDPRRRYVLKRVFPEKVLSGMREMYFGELLRGDPRAARFVEGFNRTNTHNGETELWLVFEDEGISLKSFLYSLTQSGTIEPSTFWRRLRETGSKGSSMRREIARQLVLGLHSLVLKQIVHRDLKPGNILITVDGGRRAPVKLGDFGSAIDAVSYQRGMFGVQGPTRQEHTKAYEPPEFSAIPDDHSLVYQDFRSSFDSWALGIVILEMILGTDHILELPEALKRRRRKEGRVQHHHQTHLNADASYSEKLRDFGLDDLLLFNESITALDPYGRGFFDDPKTGPLELDFVFRLLQIDPASRMSIREALDHPFMIDRADEDETADGQQEGFAYHDDNQSESNLDGSPALESSCSGAFPTVKFTCGKCGREFSSFSGCDSHSRARGHYRAKLDTKHPERAMCLTSETTTPRTKVCSDYTIIGLTKSTFWCGSAGTKSYSEDFFTSSEPHGVFVVVDGHFGEVAARFAAKSLLDHVIRDNSRVTNLSGDPSGAMTEIFLHVSRSFVESHPGSNSGAAATVLILTEHKSIIVGNVGDVRALVCCDKEYNSVVLTRDHLASDRDERIRIEALPGGVVSDRNGRPRVLGVLALSRSIGDAPFHPYVTAVPHTAMLNVSEAHWRFIVLGTDGLFDALPNEDVIGIVWMEMMRSTALVDVERMPKINEQFVESEVPWYKRAAERLVFEARARAVTLDNLGVAVIPLN